MTRVVRSLGRILAYSALGFGAGIATNMANKRLDATFPAAYGNKVAASVLKLLLVGTVLAWVELGFAQFAAAWQATTPGLFFVTVFFGVQTSLMEDVTSLAAASLA
jgi:hypothetical protein